MFKRTLRPSCTAVGKVNPTAPPTVTELHISSSSWFNQLKQKYRKLSRPKRFLAASTASVLALAVPAAYYLQYLRRLEKERLFQESIQPPTRKTPLFIAGNEPFVALNAIGASRLDLFAFYLHASLRLMALWFRALPVALRFLYAYVRPSEKNNAAAYHSFKSFLVAMGPSYIKLGQWIANRPDMIPPELGEILHDLFEKAPPHSWAESKKLLEENGLLDEFDYISEEPLNSGSIAQVHRARLKRDYVLAGDSLQSDVVTAMTAPRLKTGDGVLACSAGTEVVLKIMHPGIRKLMLADICAMRWGVSLFLGLVHGGQYLSLSQSLQEFSALILSQLDFEREADNLNQFRFNFRGDDRVLFPKPLTQLSSKQVLVETYEEGQSLVKGKPIAGLAQIATEVILKMIFEHNIIHADLHPGNLLQRFRLPDGTYSLKDQVSAKPQLVVLDPGLVTSLTPADRDNFVALFTCVATGDGDVGAELMLERSPEQNCDDRDSFKREMKKVFAVVHPGFTFAEIEVGKVLQQVLDTMRNHKVRIDMNFATLIATVIVGEGLAKRLHPDFNLFAEALPFLVKCLKSHELSYMIDKLNETYLVHP